jgi:isopentenyl-diphosphate delta-isomerase
MINSDHELLYWVDENDNVLGEIPKKQAHSDPKYIHREIAIVLCDPENKILIQQRSPLKKIDPLVWTISVAGHVTVGDTADQAAHRELQEELGFDTDLTFLYKYIIYAPQETIMEHLFLGKYSNQTIVLQEEEVAQCRLVSKSDFEQLKLSGEKIDEGSEEIMYKICNKRLK